MKYKTTEFGLIPESWDIYELKDKAEITMGQSPKSEFYNTDAKGIPFMQGRTTFGEKYHSIDTWCTDPKKYGKKNDVLMSVRAPVGDVNVATMNLCIGRGLASLRMKNNSNEFLYYLLKNYVDIIVSKQSGTVFGSINKYEIESLKLPFPNDNEQKVIGHFLKALDDKIEINNQINNNLQSISQLLFKHWFGDFEFPNEEGLPYKSSGGEMVDSELGMIPKGWKVKQLNEVKQMGTLIMGQSPSGSSYNQDKIGIPLINGAADIKDGKLVPNKYTTEPKKISKVNDLIFCIRATIGLLTIADGEYCLGRGVASITDIRDNYYEYIYQIINNSFDRFKKTASGSVYINLSKDDFNNMKLIMPDSKIIDKYHCVCAPILKSITSNKNQISELENLRDTLLPKLMNGEIDLSNVEINI